MANRRLIWQLFISYVLVTVLVLLAVTWYATSATQSLYRQQVSYDLEARGRLVLPDLVQAMGRGDPAIVDRLCKDRGAASGTRITVITDDGTVLGDSAATPAAMDNHGDRPEMQEAYRGEVGRSVRFSSTLRKNLVYVAIPFERDGRVVGVVRTASDLDRVTDDLRPIYGRIAAAGVVIAGLAAILALIISRRIARPLEELKAGAQRFAQGDLSARLPLSDTEELGSVAESLNNMAQQLDDQIRTIKEQRNEVEAILSSMVEGVIAVDTEENVIRINEAAAQVLGVRADQVEHRVIQEAVRNPALQEVVAGALSANDMVDREIVLHGEGEQYLQAHGTALRDAQGKRFGAVVVLYDMTRIKRLQNLRRDFVANVSHELRTPITSIKGFVETLQDGAIRHAEDAERFLAIIAKQADRLNAIMEDLLLLASLEQGRGDAHLPHEQGAVREMLTSAIQSCSHKAGQKNIAVEVDCPSDLTARMSPALLEQAVVNLIDNAIKYSDPETQITVAASRETDEITISVHDHGCGIEQKHLPRIFERFYRVDKARSRKLGGTGLGLAIVKHIAQVHRGSVAVQSTPGEGSVFSLHLPAA
jgi:two-component system phosphate regulon sensor histidine kinase PhoR